MKFLLKLQGPPGGRGLNGRDGSTGTMVTTLS